MGQWDGMANAWAIYVHPMRSLFRFLQQLPDTYYGGC
jgi:hypothetical protein